MPAAESARGAALGVPRRSPSFRRCELPKGATFSAGVSFFAKLGRGGVGRLVLYRARAFPAAAL